MISPEERKRIRDLSLVPALAVFVIFVLILVHLTDQGSLSSLPSYMTYLIFLLFLSFPLAMYFTRIVLFSRRLKKPLSSYRRQLFEIMMTFLLMGGVFEGFLLFFYFAFSPWIGEDAILVLAGVSFFIFLFALVIRYGNKFEKLTEGL